MNCSQFQEILQDLDRPGTEGFATRDAAFLHAESCDRCTQLLMQSESLDFALSALAEREARQQVSARVEQRLLEEFRQRNAQPSGRTGRWPIVALGTAAALLLALGLAFYSRTRHRPSTVATAAAGSKGSEKIASNGPSESSSTGTEENEATDFESATGFVSLPYADDSMASEGGAIVRVVLSRPALASLGLPVADVGATDRIPADIIVSEDGAPQAIRLVAESALE
jgi:anti-sigma-K factor RskA